MADHIITGNKGEDLALDFLVAKGHILLQRNYRYRRSEIDIITTAKGVLIFTEVKTRHGGSNHHPSYSLTHRKQSMLKGGAAAYMRENEYDWAYRFDLITVVLHDTDHEIEYYQDVFF